MPNGTTNDQWYLEVNGKKYGPYSLAQVETLIQNKQITPQDRITGGSLFGQWTTISEVLRMSKGPVTVPPRPDERTLTSLTLTQLKEPASKTGSDAIVNLFEIVQAARERKAHHPSVAGVDVGEIQALSTPPLSKGMVTVATLTLVALSGWYIFRGSNNESVKTTAVTESAPAKAQAANPVTAPAPVAPPAATTTAQNKTKTTQSTVAGFASGRTLVRPSATTASNSDREREREREMERERERENERELERERDRDRDSYARTGDSTRGGDRDRDFERGGNRTTASVRGGIPADPNMINMMGDNNPGMGRNGGEPDANGADAQGMGGSESGSGSNAYYPASP